MIFRHVFHINGNAFASNKVPFFISSHGVYFLNKIKCSLQLELLCVNGGTWRHIFMVNNKCHFNTFVVESERHLYTNPNISFWVFFSSTKKYIFRFIGENCPCTRNLHTKQHVNPHYYCYFIFRQHLYSVLGRNKPV